MNKLIVIAVTMLFGSVVLAGASDDAEKDVVPLDAKTFVMIDYIEGSSEGVDAVLTLFKVEGEKLQLKDEIHYKGADFFSMRTGTNQSVIRRVKTREQ